MASEKVYVGKAGAQELYKRVEEHIDARIPKVPGAKGNMGKFTEDGSLEDAGVSAAELESAVRDDHTHENKDILDATTAAYTTEEQAKLSGIAEGAQANVIETITVGGEPLTPTGKAVNIPNADMSMKGVVKLTSDIESADVNAAITPAAVKEALRHVGGYKVASRGQDGKPDVPQEDRSPNYIYLTEVPNTPEPDHYEEWIWSPGDQSVEAKWVLIGTTSPNLTDYVEKVDGAVEGNLASLTAGGDMADSGISGNDVADTVDKKHEHSNKEVLDATTASYTTAEKAKLAGMEEFVESFIAPGYDPNKTVYYQGELCIYEDKCYRAKNIILNSGSAIGAFDSTKWAETNFADSRLQILNYYVNYEWPSAEVTNKAIQSGSLVGLRYITPASPQYYEKENTMYWLHSYFMDEAGNISATFLNTEPTIYTEPEYVEYNSITYTIIKYTSSGNEHWTKEDDLRCPFYTYDDQYKLSGIAKGAQVNKIESISVNNVAVTPVNKNVNIVIPKAVPDPSAQNQMLFSADGATWAPVTWEIEDFGPKTISIGGREYGFVKIGNLEWMTENLDYKWNELTITTTTSSNKACATYRGGDETTYGPTGYKWNLLYNGTAVRYINDNIATIAPTGWRVPVKADFDDLMIAIGCTKTVVSDNTGYSGEMKTLRATDNIWGNWNTECTDTTGFHAVPSTRWKGNNSYDYNNAYYWCSETASAGSEQWYGVIYGDNTGAMSHFSKQFGCAVRLVKGTLPAGE